MSSDIEMLVSFWETIKEYIPAKDKQIACDHAINELVDLGIDDNDLKELAVDKYMLNAVKQHIDEEDLDEDNED